MVAAGALIFLTDSHHLMLRGLAHSYDLLAAGWLPLGDLAGQMVQLAVKSLGVAALLGAPFFVFGVLYNLARGVANRVMPALPVFFVAGPATILVGLWLLWLSSEAILRNFADLFAAFFLTLTP
jgi:flagellar biosynthetic protein FliR